MCVGTYQHCCSQIELVKELRDEYVDISCPANRVQNKGLLRRIEFRTCLSYLPLFEGVQCANQGKCREEMHEDFLTEDTT